MLINFCNNERENVLTQPAFTCPKSTKETQQKCVKSIHS